MTTLSEVREAFSKALETSPGERDALLATLPEGVRSEVLSLLEAHETAGGFLGSLDDVPEGERIGPYQILDRIGQGGMGVVYRARRDDGEFRRDVAIKLVSGRLFPPEAQRRFITERGILALLDHPNIVRMIDGGLWQTNRYLVMELVSGESLTQYATKLDLRARLRLFQQVCSAIQYAHQHLVLHRDLKPTNILVTAEGGVKILDFGIARLLDPEGPEENSATVLNPFTLSCASPEQVRGERLTLATDIYSLGILLYELLTGQNPQSSGTRPEITSRILDAVPAAPSRISRDVPEDLDAIVFKALAKDPAERYASAGELSADVGRFLDGLPVEARPPSMIYHARRFVVRNKALSATVVALILAVIGGSAAALWQAHQAETQRQIAERRFNAARSMAYTIIHDIQPKLAGVNGTVALRKDLIEKTLVYLEALGKDAGNSPPLLRELIESYTRLASVSSNASEANVGDVTGSAGILKRASGLAAELSRVDPNGAASLLVLSEFYNQQANYSSTYGLREEAIEQAKHSISLAEKLAQVSPGFDSQNKIAIATSTLAGITVWSSPDQAIPLYERAAAIWTEGLNAKPSTASILRRNIALMYRDLATAWSRKSDPQRSLEYALRALDADRSLVVGTPVTPRSEMDLAFDLGAVANGYVDLKQYDKAGDYMRESIALREKVAAANRDDRAAQERLAFQVFRLANLQSVQHDAEGAARSFRRSEAIYEGLSRSAPLVDQSLLNRARGSFALFQYEHRRGLKREECSWVRKAASLAGEYKARVHKDALEKNDWKEASAALQSCGAQ